MVAIWWENHPGHQSPLLCHCGSRAFGLRKALKGGERRGSMAREPTASPVLTKWWKWELILATNFGSHVQMVTKFGGQILAIKFGFVPDCLYWDSPLILLEYFNFSTRRNKKGNDIAFIAYSFIFSACVMLSLGIRKVGFLKIILTLFISWKLIVMYFNHYLFDKWENNYFVNISSCINNSWISWN